jgi:hypothetical protein
MSIRGEGCLLAETSKYIMKQDAHELTGGQQWSSRGEIYVRAVCGPGGDGIRKHTYSSAIGHQQSVKIIDTTGESLKPSSRSLSFCKNIAAGASSMIRWSGKRFKYIVQRAAMRHDTITGRSATRPTLLMPYCGQLTME